MTCCELRSMSAGSSRIQASSRIWFLVGTGGWIRDRVVFFFQAEDGIRDVAVTGVQTCALPIWPENVNRVRIVIRPVPTPFPTVQPPAVVAAERHVINPCRRVPRQKEVPLHVAVEIGRASCRERV